MKDVLKSILLTAIVVAGAVISDARAGEESTGKDFSAFADKVLKEWRSLKPGVSTRADLNKIFNGEVGGIGNATRLSYTYRDCSYIVVDVTFTLSKEPREKNLKVAREGLAIGYDPDDLGTVSELPEGGLAWRIG